MAIHIGKSLILKINLILPTLSLASCTTISIQGEAKISRENLLTPVKIEYPNETQTVITRSQGFGIIPNTSGIVIGYYNEQRIAIQNPQRCQIIFLTEKKEDIENTIKILSKNGIEIERICILPRGE